MLSLGDNTRIFLANPPQIFGSRSTVRCGLVEGSFGMNAISSALFIFSQSSGYAGAHLVLGWIWLLRLEEGTFR